MVLLYETLSGLAKGGGYQDSTTTLQQHKVNNKNNRILMSAGLYEANDDGETEILIGGKLACKFDFVTTTSDIAMSDKYMVPIGFFWKRGDDLQINILDAYTSAPKISMCIITIPNRKRNYRRRRY